jgi:hypothetical protein
MDESTILQYQQSEIKPTSHLHSLNTQKNHGIMTRGDRCGRDRLVVGFTS